MENVTVKFAHRVTIYTPEKFANELGVHAAKTIGGSTVTPPGVGYWFDDNGKRHDDATCLVIVYSTDRDVLDAFINWSGQLLAAGGELSMLIDDTTHGAVIVKLN